MKTIERYLCAECAKGMRDAKIVYKKVPYSEGNAEKCDWCRRTRYGAKYAIQYGKERGHAEG